MSVPLNGVRRWLAVALRLVALAGTILVVARLVQARRVVSPDIPLVPAEDGPVPPVSETALPESPVTPPAWVEPSADGCPASHPVKAKLSSGIYHLPGMLAYDRTQPDRCYLDELSAQADGLRKSKR